MKKGISMFISLDESKPPIKIRHYSIKFALLDLIDHLKANELISSDEKKLLWKDMNNLKGLL
jgi:hypothetical protein